MMDTFRRLLEFCDYWMMWRLEVMGVSSLGCC